MSRSDSLPLLLLALCSTAFPQTSGGRPEPIVSPEVGADRKVTFRIRAAKASDVYVSASIGTLNPKPEGATRRAPLRKGATR